MCRRSFAIRLRMYLRRLAVCRLDISALHRTAFLRVSAAAALADGCAEEIDVTECQEIHSKTRCEDANVVQQGACYWLPVVEARAADGVCATHDAGHQCVGISGTELGCGSESCPDKVSDTGNAWFRNSGGSIELIVNPECGPTPWGDWQSCAGNQRPECLCLCE